MKNILLPALIFCVISTSAQFKLIKLDEAKGEGYPPAEPSVVINRKNPGNIVVASILDNVYSSLDSGKTWNKNKLTSEYGVFGDPVLVNGKKNTIHLFHLANPPSGDKLDRIVCQTSEDGGLTWAKESYVGLNGSKDQDKPMGTYNFSDNEIYVAWTQFDQYGSANPDHKSNILFSSSSKGRKWSDPVKINQFEGNCLDDDLTVMGGTPTVNSYGRIFLTYAYNEKIYIDRSFDGGKMWLRNDIVIADQPGGWNHSIPGLKRANGIPTIITDNSGSVLNGNIYVVWADQRNGKDNTDIFLSRSNRNGDIWTRPEKINSDNTASHQFMPVARVDNANGVLYVLYYDRRNHDDLKTDLYLSYSLDGGSKFTDVKITEKPFVPSSEAFLGDYIALDVFNGRIVPVWTQVDESGKTSIWTAVIKFSDIYDK